MPEKAPESIGPASHKEFASVRADLAKMEKVKALSRLPVSLAIIRTALEDSYHPIFVLPEAATPAMFREQLELQELLRTVARAVDGAEAVQLTPEKITVVESMVESVTARLVAFESASMAAARGQLDSIVRDPAMAEQRSQLQVALGARGTPEQFDDFMRACAAEIPPPDPKNGDFSEPQRARLAQSHRKLAALQYKLVDNVFNLSVLELRRRALFPGKDEGEGLEEGERKQILKKIGVFLMMRAEYEAQLRKQPFAPPSQVTAIMGTVVEELTEEGFEESLGFGKPLVKPPAYLRNLDAAARIRMMQGFEEASKMVGQRCPSLANLMTGIDKSPLGRKFWSQLLTIESPVTVALFMIHVHNSPNKLKASMDFAGFLTVSALSGAMLETVTALLVTGARAYSAQRQFAMAHRLMWLARMPKNPVVQFTAAIAIAFGVATYVDSFTTWVDGMIPEGPTKRAINDGISVAFGSSIAESAEFGAVELGMMNVDPEQDSFSYLSRELVTIEWNGGMKRRKMNGILDWNAAVDRRIAAENNPMAKRLFEREKANHGPWVEREAFYTFSEVQNARSLQTSIASELVARGQLKNPASFDLLYWATADEGEERPDHTVARMRTDAITLAQASGTSSSVEGRMAVYLNGLKDSTVPVDKELYSQWKRYCVAIDEVAKRVTTFRHLGVYNKKQWVGEAAGQSMTPFVQKGIAAEIVYRMDRNDILTYRDGPGSQARDEFARALTALTKPDYKKHDVSSVWFNQLFTSGFLIDPRSHFHKHSLLAAAEAAAQYLPKDHDVNVLFAELRDAVTHKKGLSEAEMDKMRDDFTAAMVQYQESKARLAEATPDTLKGLSSPTFFAADVNKDFAAAYAENVKDGRDPSFVLLEYAFKDDFAKEKEADLHVVQSIIPGYRTGETPSRYECAALIHTSIRCNGADPKEWRVRIARRTLAKNAFTDPQAYERLQAPAEKSETIVVDFLTWVEAHPEFAKQLEGSLTAIRARKAAEQRKIDAPREKALEKARTSKSAFIAIPGSKEYRRAIDGGQAIVHELSERHSFNSDEDPYERGSPGASFGKTTIGDYSVDIETNGKRRTIKISPESIRSIEGMPEAEQRLIRDVVTTPIEGQDEKSITATLNVFLHPHTSVSNAGYAFGWRPTFHYSTLLKGVLPLYEKAANKKTFLEDLYDFIATKGGKIDEATAVDALKTLEKRSFMYGEKFGATERNRYLKIAAALGTPDEGGIFAKDAGGKGETIYYYFHPETMRWQWSFDRENWQRMDNMTGKTSRGTREPNLFNKVYMQEVLPSFLAK